MAKPSGEYVGEIWADNQRGEMHKEIFRQGRNTEIFSKFQADFLSIVLK